MELLPGNEVVIHWYMRSKKRRVFEAQVNSDGTPYCQNLSMDSIMMWEMKENRKENGRY